MGWIKNTDPETHPTRALKSELTNGERVEFSSNWKANVSDVVEEQLCNEYDHLVPVEQSPSGDAEADETDTTED